MQNLPQIVNKKHKLVNGNPVPSEKMNKWGHPSSEHYVFEGSIVIRNEHTRVDEETDEKRKVLIVSYISTWSAINPNEKTATQLHKEKTARKKKNTSVNAKAARYAKGVSKNALYQQCLKRGLPVSGTKLQMATRILAFDNAPTTADLSIDEEGNVINPAKEESE